MGSAFKNLFLKVNDTPIVKMKIGNYRKIKKNVINIKKNIIATCSKIPKAFLMRNLECIALQSNYTLSIFSRFFGFFLRVGWEVKLYLIYFI